MTNEIGYLYGEQQGGEHCCNRAELLWAQDDLILAATEDRPLPTAAIDVLPPWRARMVVQMLLRAGATLQDGTPDLLDTAASAAARVNPGAKGWWREALGMPAPAPAAPARRNGYPVPTGWPSKTTRT